MKCKLILLLLVLAACSGNATQKGDNITITADVQKIPEQGFSLSYLRSIVRGFEFDKNKHAECTIEDYDYLYLNIHNGFKERKLMYAEKGDRVNLTFDGESMANSLVITGGYQPIQEYLDSVNIEWLPEEAFALEVPDFIARLQELVAQNQTLVNQYSGAINKVNKNFVKREKSRIKYMMGLSILDYARAHGQMANLQDYKPGEDYYNALLAWMDEDPDLVNIAEYRTVVTEGISFVNHWKDPIKSPLDKTMKQVEYIRKHFKNEQLKQTLTTLLVSDYVENFGLNHTNDLITFYRQNVTDKKLLAQFQQIYDSWDRISPGKEAPDFQAVDSTGKEYSLKDFRGKYVYLYLWPTFYPSIKEFSYLQELRPLLEERNVHLVSLSIDQTPDSWKGAIQNKDIQIGTHLFLGWNKNLLKTYHYNSNNMYQFILIDPEGKIVESHAPRPSSGKMEEFIKISTQN